MENKQQMCNEGDLLLGGGFELIAGATATHAPESRPATNADGNFLNGWTASANLRLKAYAVCGVTS